MSFKDYYSILGTTSSATQDEIKRVYKKLAMQYHPDRNAGFQEESEKRMKEINEAYNTLSDSEKRRVYDYEYYESKWSGNTSEKKEKSSSESSSKKQKNESKTSDSGTSQKKNSPKASIKTRFFSYLKRFWFWGIGLFRRLPVIIQFWFIVMVLWGFASVFDSIFSEEKPYQYTPTIYRVTSSTEPTNTTVSRANSGTVNDMFSVYCGLNRLFVLHSIAPESKYYKRLMENNSDVSSQIAIAPRLIAERLIIWIPSLLENISDTTWPFKDSLSILKESDERLLRFLENMNYIQSVDDFKKNMIADYAVSANLLKGFPEVFAREYKNYPNQSESNASVLIVNGSMMCNGDADISFWDSWLSEVNATSEELGSRRIMQDANFRKTPWTNGEIIHPLIKGEYVTVLDKKKVGSMEWYEVEQYYTKWWVSYLAFIDDPSKASAADCDPVNGYIDEKWYCSCKEGYKWMGSVRACVLKSTISWERILSEMEINIATCGMGGYLSPYSNKCECDYKEWYWMGSNGKCEKR